MDLAMSNDQRAAVIVAAIWIAVIVAALFGVALDNLKERYGQLPRGVRWVPQLWQGTKIGAGGWLLRLFYPEVWRARREKKGFGA